MIPLLHYSIKGKIGCSFYAPYYQIENIYYVQYTSIFSAMLATDKEQPNKTFFCIDISGAKEK